MQNVLLAFFLTLLAGLSTGIGGLLAFFTKKDNKIFLAVSLGFSAGVMIYVSMIEIFQEAQSILTVQLGGKLGGLTTTLAFFGGMLLIAIIDKLIPDSENPHDLKKIPNEECKSTEPQHLKRLGVLTALAIGIHNFPEGIASFIASLQNPSIAIPTVVAIAIHNIPEGISVSVPIYQSTGSKLKALKYSFLSGLAEPIGALVAWLILMPILNDVVFGIIFAAVAGIMVFISFDELLPAARESGENHLSISGLISGMVIMSVSLLIFI